MSYGAFFFFTEIFKGLIINTEADDIGKSLLLKETSGSQTLCPVTEQPLDRIVKENEMLMNMQ